MQTFVNKLEKMYRDCRKELFIWALAITRCPHRAEDAIQEAFYRLFRMEAKPRRLKAYVFRAVRNAAINQLHRNPQPADELTEFIFDPSPGPRDNAANNEFRRRVADGLLGLSEDERETIILHIYAGLTFRKIACVLEAPFGSVASWYRRGLSKIRERLEKGP